MTSHDKQVRRAIEARFNSIKQLCDLYIVVISIAAGLAFRDIVDPGIRPIPIRIDRLVLFGAFMITVIPFFHGGVRHLYATYIEVGGSSRVKNWVVLIDYYLLFVGGGLFVALSSCLDNAHAFAVVLTGLLTLDIVWGILAQIGFGGTQAQRTELSWAKINAVTVVVLLMFLLTERALLGARLGETDLRLFLLLLASVRTGVDYYWNHAFYCPPYPTPIAHNATTNE